MTTETSKQIADNIYRRLGGNKFAAMTGAKNFGFIGTSLSFKIMRNAKKVTFVKITLNPLDLYDVTYMNVNGNTISESKDLYNDMIVKDFETNTGLYTRL